MGSLAVFPSSGHADSLNVWPAGIGASLLLAETSLQTFFDIEINAMVNSASDWDPHS